MDLSLSDFHSLAGKTRNDLRGGSNGKSTSSQGKMRSQDAYGTLEINCCLIKFRKDPTKWAAPIPLFFFSFANVFRKVKMNDNSDRFLLIVQITFICVTIPFSYTNECNCCQLGHLACSFSHPQIKLIFLQHSTLHTTLQLKSLQLLLLFA